MDKLTKTFEYLLKDFKPNLDYKEVWIETGFGSKMLKRNTLKLTENNKIEFPFIVYIIFVEIKKYDYFRRYENVNWEIPIIYKNIEFVLAHRKFGFDISISEFTEDAEILANEAIQQIKKSIPFAETLISSKIKEKVNQGKITIQSQYTETRNRYLYYKEKVVESSNSDTENLKSKIENFKPENYKSKEEFIIAYDEIQRLKNSRYYHILSMIDAYFSYIEHISVLLLPFLRYINLKSIDIENFIGQNWKYKLQVILQNNTNKEATKLIEILDEIKEQIRNPASHGNYFKNGKSFFVQMENIGSIPFTLTKKKATFKYSFSSKHFMQYSDIIQHFENFDLYLDTYETKFGMQYIKRNLPVWYDLKSISTYRRRMKSEKSTGKFINDTIRDIENAMNMDW